MTGQPPAPPKTLVWEMGLDDKTRALLKDVYKISIFSIPQKPDLVFNLNFPKPDVVLVGGNATDEIRAEIVQIVGLKYVGTPIIYITREFKGLDRTRIISEGFSEVFLLPYEQSYFEENLNQYLSIQDSAVKKMFEAIKIADLNSNSELSFDVNVFLRANRKFICFAKKGQRLSTQKIDKLKEKSNAVYVTKEEMAAFYNYVKVEAERTNNPDQMSFTERKSRFTQSVKTFFRAMLYESRKNPVSTETLNKFLTECKQQISQYITQTTFELFPKRFLDNCGDRFDLSYLHACNVSMYAGFLSVSTNIGKPEDLAIAGILHDIGMVALPEDILEKHPDQMNNNEKSTYYTHVQRALNEINAKNLEVSPLVTKIIAQHHEQYCGKGYPVGLKHDKVMAEAQLLALADQLDELTCYNSERDALHPLKAMRYIAHEENKNVHINKRYDPKFLQMILDLFENAFKGPGLKSA